MDMSTNEPDGAIEDHITVYQLKEPLEAFKQEYGRVIHRGSKVMMILGLFILITGLTGLGISMDTFYPPNIGGDGCSVWGGVFFFATGAFGFVASTPNRFHQFMGVHVAMIMGSAFLVGPVVFGVSVFWCVNVVKKNYWIYIKYDGDATFEGERSVESTFVSVHAIIALFALIYWGIATWTTIMLLRRAYEFRRIPKHGVYFRQLDPQSPTELCTDTIVLVEE